MSVGAVVKALASAAARSAPSGDHPELAGHFASVIDVGGVQIAIGTDGVGTKHLLAKTPKHFRGIAIDCAAMNANDIICVGATPIAIVDYLACETTDGLEPYAIAIADGFTEAEWQGAGGVVGGEVAVLPEIIAPRDDGVPALDLAATCIGVVNSALLTGQATKPGDVVIGVRSSGLHSNGFTRMRRLVCDQRLDLDAQAPWGGEGTVREQLLVPTVLYPRLMSVMAGGDLHAAANITGGGIANLARVLPTCGAHIDAWPELSPLFAWIAERVPAAEAWAQFNMGVGFMLVVAAESVDAIFDVVPPGYEAYVVGVVAADLPPATVELAVGGGHGRSARLVADRHSVWPA